MYLGLMQSARYFCLSVSKFGFSGQNFINVPNTKFHRNPASGSRADTCGQTDRRTWRSSEGAFRDYANAPKINCFCFMCFVKSKTFVIVVNCFHRPDTT
jgi:hypothetical protein